LGVFHDNDPFDPEAAFTFDRPRAHNDLLPSRALLSTSSPSDREIMLRFGTIFNSRVQVD